MNLKNIDDKFSQLNYPTAPFNLHICSDFFNPYPPNVTFLHPLKTSENLRFSDVFRGYRNVTLGEYGLITRDKTHNTFG